MKDVQKFDEDELYPSYVKSPCETWKHLKFELICRPYLLVQLGKILNPPKALGGDVKDLAAHLLENCNNDDVRFADFSCACLTSFTLRKWMICNRNGTVGELIDCLNNIRRLDAVELVTEAAKDFQNRPNHHHVVESYNTSDSASVEKETECKIDDKQKEFETSATTITYPATPKDLCNKNVFVKKGGMIGAIQSPFKKKEKPNSNVKSEKPTAPKVFIVYSNDTQNHVDRIKRFANSLRNKGFDARIDKVQIGEGVTSNSQYLYKELRTACYVIVAASPMLWQTLKIADECFDGSIPMPNDHTKAIGLIMTYIRDDLFRNGCCFKRYLTVLMEGIKEKYIPNALKPAVVHRWPTDETKILYRLLQKKEYVLEPIGEPPKIKSKVINDKLFANGLKL